jgi:hypothetical protein
VTAYNHSAIYAKILIGEIDLNMEKVIPSRRIKWDRATDEARLNYKNLLAKKLNLLSVPSCAACVNVHCSEHTECIEDYTMEVLKAVEDVSKDTLPVSVSGGTHSSKKRTPGWCEFVQPWLEESKFWNCLWESAGKPAEGDLSNAIMQAKQQYKYAVRRLKQAG